MKAGERGVTERRTRKSGGKGGGKQRSLLLLVCRDVEVGVDPAVIEKEKEKKEKERESETQTELGAGLISLIHRGNRRGSVM